MPPDSAFHMILQTPRALLFAGDVSSLCVPTESGQVGLHPRHEATVLAVEAGLVLARCGEQWRFMGSSGGILSSDGGTARLLTPLAVVGNSAAEAIAALDLALSEPNSEMQARTKLSQLETGIVNQLRQPNRTAPAMKRA